MESPIALDRIFNEKLFRIPDYQRGYAWQYEQLRAFWEDLGNLKDGQPHYTGVLKLAEVKSDGISKDQKEFWLVNDNSYRLYHVVDGQQRLTTAVICIQALVDVLRSLPGLQGLEPSKQFVTEGLTVANIEARYLFRVHPRGDFRTNVFGYTEDNPSDNYLRYRVLGERGGGEVTETFYTLNLSNAKAYFSNQFSELNRRKGLPGLADLYKRLTKQFLFDESVIKSEFDVFVTFETMNNRGKKLSDLELLKNRLIYLTTLYDNNELDEATRKSLRDEINAAWKETYAQLGRNSHGPLNDDDFLRAHWISFFKYSRKTGKDYVRFLLDTHFTPRRVHEVIEVNASLETAEERSSERDLADSEEEIAESSDAASEATSPPLEPREIREYVRSLRDSAAHWFTTWYPEQSSRLSQAEIAAIDRLNRIGIAYFRPLVMVIRNTVDEEVLRIQLYDKIERFIFIAFRIGMTRSNYGSSELLGLASSLFHKRITMEDLSKRLDKLLTGWFAEDGTLRTDDFYNALSKRFRDGGGYYDWSGLRYFLFEYEQELLEQSRQAKIGWSSLLKTGRDRISIEHIFPQTPSADWKESFGEIPDKEWSRYNGSIGNLLLLSMSINSALQNDAFSDKKTPKFDANGDKIRNGYSDGSHSEIEVSRLPTWGPDEIVKRGLGLLKFMERRWGFRLSDPDRSKLLFIEGSSA